MTFVVLQELSYMLALIKWEVRNIVFGRFPTEYIHLPAISSQGLFNCVFADEYQTSFDYTNIKCFVNVVYFCHILQEQQ